MNMNSGSKPSSQQRISVTHSSPPQSQNHLDSYSQQSQSMLLEHLDLTFFKVTPCSNQTSHNHKQCKFFHGPKDRRRMHVDYSSDMCEYIENDKQCQYGDDCLKAHNKVEQLYSMDKYKTKFCTLYPNGCANCDYGTYCSFAHTEQDIQIELIHNYDFDEDFYIFYYKTIWCPFNFMSHDRGQCVYAHNWQDYRRKPQLFKYESVPCQFWKPEEFITKYEDGCGNQYQCTKCHGWKEYEYHPLNYRTKPCATGQNCTKGQACPYFHNLQEKRILPPNIQSKLFRYAPRNRVLKNTYKQYNSLTPSDYKQVKRSSYQSTGMFSNNSYLSIEKLAILDQHNRNETVKNSNEESDEDQDPENNSHSREPSHQSNEYNQSFNRKDERMIYMTSSQKRHSLQTPKDIESTEIIKKAQKRMSIKQGIETGGQFSGKQQKSGKKVGLSTNSQSFQPGIFMGSNQKINEEHKAYEKQKQNNSSSQDEDNEMVDSIVNKIFD